jgi:hypothetical protein
MRSFDVEAKLRDSERRRVCLPVDCPAKIKFASMPGSGCEHRSRGKKWVPLPHPLPSLESSSYGRFGLQNLDVKELRGQNLDNKGLRARRVALEQTVTASTIIAELICGGKVRCHRQAVEKDLWLRLTNY